MIESVNCTTRRPMRADARRNYDRILVAAHEVFVEQGTDASLEEVARRAGVGIGTLYRHFPVREELLLSVIESTMVNSHALAKDLLTASDPAAALEEYALYWLQNTAMYKGVAAECMNQALDSDAPWTSRCHLMQQDSQKLLERAQQAGSIRPDVTHKDVWRLLNGLVLGVKDASISPEHGLTLFNVVMKGLRT